VIALYKRSAILGSLSAAGLSLAIYAASPWLLQFWTHGRIPFVPSVMGWLLAYAAIAGAAYVPRTILLATNQHIGLAGWSLAAALVSVALAWALGAFAGLLGVSIAMFAAEVAIAALCFRVADIVFVSSGRKQNVIDT
jgi:hypothetical protein